MAEVPLELPTGRVVGKFIFEVQDNNDPGEDPQLVPVTGDITIKSAIDNLTIFDQTLGKFITFRGPHKAILNSEGELATPDPDTGEPMYTGMSLWSNDSDNLSVKGWTYTATFNLKTADGRALALQPVTFTLATGQEVNLADVVKVPATPGYGLPQAEGAALRAEAAAQVALDVKAMADAGEFDGAQGLPGNATMRIDNTIGTRVFITDGTDEQLISSDTGWRDLTENFSLLDNDPKLTALSIKVRRIDETVYLEAIVMSADNNFPSNTTIMSNTIYGFRSAGNYDWSAGYYGSTAIIAGTMGTSAYIKARLIPNVALSVGIRLKTQWMTSDPWPIGLPGIPA